MPISRKMQNIVCFLLFFFIEKCIFSNEDYFVQNLTYQLQTGFNRILKGWKCGVNTLHVSDRLK